MDRDRRKAIAALREKIEVVAGPLDDLRGEVELLRDVEQEYYDTIPDCLQGGVRGRISERAVSFLEIAIKALEQIESSVSEATNALSDAESR